MCSPRWLERPGSSKGHEYTIEKTRVRSLLVNEIRRSSDLFLYNPRPAEMGLEAFQKFYSRPGNTVEELIAEMTHFISKNCTGHSLAHQSRKYLVVRQPRTTHSPKVTQRDLQDHPSRQLYFPGSRHYVKSPDTFFQNTRRYVQTMKDDKCRKHRTSIERISQNSMQLPSLCIRHLSGIPRR